MNWDSVIGWVMVGLSLSVLAGVILALACGYGDDPTERTVYICHCGDVATVTISTPGLRAFGWTHYCTRHADEILARAYYPPGYGDES